MATRASLGAHALEAMRHTNNVIEEHSPGHADKLATVFPNGGEPPIRTESADELLRIVAYLAEQNASLADIVDRLAKESAPRRGRPRKDTGA